jgi:undecaprenyl-diphosphatase
MQLLLWFDEYLFHLVNGTNIGWLNSIAPLLREKTTWIPLYLLLAAWCMWRYSWRTALTLLVASALTVAVADTTSSKILKPLIQRERPCRAVPDAIVRVPCGGGFSFPSSHAANHFALAALWIRGLHQQRRLNVLWWAWWWAATIALAQVYVGVHYPLDITAGAILGVGIGSVFARLWQQLRQWWPGLGSA